MKKFLKNLFKFRIYIGIFLLTMIITVIVILPNVPKNWRMSDSSNKSRVIDTRLSSNKSRIIDNEVFSVDSFTSIGAIVFIYAILFWPCWFCFCILNQRWHERKITKYKDFKKRLEKIEALFKEGFFEKSKYDYNSTIFNVYYQNEMYETALKRLEETALLDKKTENKAILNFVLVFIIIPPLIVLYIVSLVLKLFHIESPFLVTKDKHAEGKQNGGNVKELINLINICSCYIELNFLDKAHDCINRIEDFISANFKNNSGNYKYAIYSLTWLNVRLLIAENNFKDLPPQLSKLKENKKYARKMKLTLMLYDSQLDIENGDTTIAEKKLTYILKNYKYKNDQFIYKVENLLLKIQKV